MGKHISNTLRRLDERDNCDDTIFCSIVCFHFCLRNRCLFDWVSNSKIANYALEALKKFSSNLNYSICITITNSFTVNGTIAKRQDIRN